LDKLHKQTRYYLTLIALIATSLLVWSIISLRFANLTFDNVVALFLFGLTAIVLEIFAVEMPYFGYKSLAFSAYLALLMKFSDYPEVALIAVIGLGARQLFINKQNIWLRVTDFSSNITSLILAGMVYTVINQNAELFSMQNSIALVLTVIVYYGLDFFFSFSISDMLDEDVLRRFDAVKFKVHLYYSITLPLGLLMIQAFNISYFLFLFSLPPFVALRKSLLFAVREIAIIDQQRLQEQVDKLENSLIVAQEQSRDLATDLSKKIDEQSILVEMGEALGTSVNLESTLEIVVSMVHKMMMYQSCVIFLINEGTLIAAKCVSPYRDILEYSSLLKLEESIVNLVVQNKKPILIPDMQSMSGEQRIFKDERSVVCVPLIVKNENIGVIYVGSTRPGTYNEDHLHLLSILGNAASNAIRISQLYDAAEQKSFALEQLNQKLDTKIQSFEMLLAIGQKLGSSLNLEEAQKIIIDGLENMFHYQSAAVFLVRRDKTNSSSLLATKFRSPYELFFENLKLSLEDQSNIMGWISYYRKPLLLDDTKNTKIQTILDNERSSMVVPMIVENELTGAIYIGHPEPGRYNDEMLRLLEAVSHNAAMAIKNAEIFEITEKEAITDGLTGLYTIRYFQERLTEELNHAKRRKTGIALAMIDADNFKTLNDTLGHPEGDKCLKTLADIMRKFTRESDLVCRIGGDEFIIILKEIDKNNALLKAELVRQAVEATFKNSTVQITTSIGLACFPEDGDNKKDLIASADAALYKSKKMGRNRVSMATGPITPDFKMEPLPRD
jgi:diguanylate cyclase (GGDEF)-like protein